MLSTRLLLMMSVLAGAIALACGELSSLGGPCRESKDCDDGQVCAASRCEASPDDADGAATLGESGETSECEPGTLGCSCVDAACDAPLICLDETCSSPANPTSQGAEDDSVGTATADPTTGDGPCATNEDCSFAEVCLLDGSCIDAGSAAYVMTVMSWAPTTCDGGRLGDGNADLKWSLELDGVVVYTSAWVQGGCRGSWPDEPVCFEAGSFLLPFELSLIDEDISAHDLVDMLWWDDDADQVPDLLPPGYLSFGEYNETTGSGGLLRIQFDLVDGCE